MKRITFRYSHWNDGGHKFVADVWEMSDDEFSGYSEEELFNQGLELTMEKLSCWYDVEDVGEDE